MSIFNHDNEDSVGTERSPSISPLKTIAIAAGTLFAVSHIGLLGYVLRPQEPVQQPPTFNLPRGPYSSYKIKAWKGWI